MKLHFRMSRRSHLWPQKKSNSANYACRHCSRKLCGIPCCGKSTQCSRVQLKSLFIFCKGMMNGPIRDLIRMPGEAVSEITRDDAK